MSDSPRILLVHGLTGHLHAPALLEALRPATVVAPDLLGYGACADVDPVSITLAAQVDVLREAIDEAAGPADRWLVVGHSVGGAIAHLFAAKYPDRAAAVVSVEGNFALDDAFWSQRLASMPLREIKAQLQRDLDDPAGWLARAGLRTDAELIAAAADQLAFQPASTLQRMAISVVETTGAPAYLQRIAGWLDKVPLHLLAGERSARDWHVPDWLRPRAQSDRTLAGRGHMMMLEDPRQFANAILDIALAR